ncbi:MAG: hypothetical protein NVV63_08710 [Opitutus sp.]|nr:hypothetical protein [Opitutus sp.]
MNKDNGVAIAVLVATRPVPKPCESGRGSSALSVQNALTTHVEGRDRSGARQVQVIALRRMLDDHETANEGTQRSTGRLSEYFGKS